MTSVTVSKSPRYISTRIRLRSNPPIFRIAALCHGYIDARVLAAMTHLVTLLYYASYGPTGKQILCQNTSISVKAI